MVDCADIGSLALLRKCWPREAPEECPLATLFGIALWLALWAGAAPAQEARTFRLALDPEIAASGLADYILPRFALKTGRRAELVEAEADLAIATDAGSAAGQPLMARDGRLFHLVTLTDNPAAARFAEWAVSEIGQNTIAAFTPETGPGFTTTPQETAVAEIVFDGDAALGRQVAERQCSRCHRVTQERSGMGIGSTPSFPALRSLADWPARFQAFYALNPHPAFLRVAGLSPPFDPERPPPIVPVELTREEVEAIGAYAAGLAPADLGAAVAHQ